MRKKTFLIIALLVIAINFSFAQVSLPHYEAFNYTVGDSLPMHGWTGINSGDQILVTAGNLSITGLFASSGNKISFDAGGRDFQRTITPQTTGTVYISFIMQVSSVGGMNATGGYFTGFASNTTTFGAKTWIRLSGAGYNLGIYPGPSGGTTTWDATVLAVNTPVLVVMSYELVSGTTNDIVKMWINPSSSSFGGTSPPTPTINITNAGTDLASIDRIFLRQDNATATPFIDMDEIRIANTWALVTPAFVGINESKENSLFGVYPNPSNGNFKILLSDINSSHGLKVYNCLGDVVFAKDGVSTELNLDLSKLDKGIYYVQLKNNIKNLTATRKIVIQ
jgi:hypothetical protein